MTEVELGRRERKKEETRQRIYQAALDLFRKKGVDATTVDDITERADVAKGTFFNYYPRKESILFDLCFDHMSEVEDHRSTLAESMPAIEQMLEGLRHGARLYMKDRDLSRAMLLQLFKGATPAPEAFAINQRAQDMIRIQVERAQKAGELRADVDPERAAYIVRSIFFLTVLVWVCSPESPYDLSDELVARVRLAFEGLSARSAGVA